MTAYYNEIDTYAVRHCKGHDRPMGLTIHQPQPAHAGFSSLPHCLPYRQGVKWVCWLGLE